MQFRVCEGWTPPPSKVTPPQLVTCSLPLCPEASVPGPSKNVGPPSPGAAGSSLLECGVCCGIRSELLTRASGSSSSMWEKHSQMSLLCVTCVTATLKCLCSFSFGTLMSARGRGKGMQMVLLEQCLLWWKEKFREGMKRMSLSNSWGRSGSLALWGLRPAGTRPLKLIEGVIGMTLSALWG